MPCRPLERLDVARVQPGRPAAAGSLGQRAVDPVALEDPDQVTADAGVHVLDEAGRRRRPPGAGAAPAGGGGGPGAAGEPGGEALPGVGGEDPLGGHAHRLLHEPLRASDPAGRSGR